MTGVALLRYVYTYLTEHPEEIAEFDAVLIEDDLDGRFYEETIPGEKTSIVSKRTAGFEKYHDEIKKNVCERLGKDDSFPVLRFFAAPEIEAWFLADWEDTFGLLYGPKGLSILTAGECDFFSTRFWSHIKNEVLMGYTDRIEEYGYFSGGYKKLSDEMLRRSSPHKIREKCLLYFRETYDQLKSL